MFIVGSWLVKKIYNLQKALLIQELCLEYYFPVLLLDRKGARRREKLNKERPVRDGSLFITGEGRSGNFAMSMKFTRSPLRPCSILMTLPHCQSI